MDIVTLEGGDALKASVPSLRDRFAMAALTGMSIAFGQTFSPPKDMAEAAYEMADAMLVAGAAGGGKVMPKPKWKAPKPEYAELYQDWLERVIESLEEFVNR